MRIVNLSRKLVVAREVENCGAFLGRLFGWLGKKKLPSPGQGLYLAPCRCVHTLGMRFSIDVVFLNHQGIILRTLTLAPWRLSPFIPAARGVLELPAGTCAQGACGPGDQLEQQNGKGW